MIEVVCLTKTIDAQEVLNLPRHITYSFPLRIVKGIEVPGISPLLSAEARRGGRNIIHEEPMTLPVQKARRLSEFVSRIVVDKEPIYRNCVSFAAYIAGGLALDAACPDMTCEAGSLYEVDPRQLVSGDPYLVYLSDQKTAVHGIVGSGKPNENLAVWGDNNPLAFGSNIDMMATYNAAHILSPEGTFTLR